MTTNFDPTKHRFGMAYYLTDVNCNIITLFDDNQAVVYVVDYNKNHASYAWSDGGLREISIRRLKRAPEHDLIPRDDVMELVKALERICIGSAYEIGWVSDGKDYGVAHQALANFKQKYGDDT